MKRCILAIGFLAMVVPTAGASHFATGFGRMGGMGPGGHDLGALLYGFRDHGEGAFEHGNWHRGFGWFGFSPLGLGPFGYGWFGLDGVQTHFENRFADLMSEYSMGLADVEDFFNSDVYTDVVGDVQRLADRYGLFLSGAERNVDRLGDVIQIFNDDLTYYTDLIAEYQARDDLPERYLERITMRLTGIQDHLSMKIDRLTEKQTMLSENIGAYQMFSDDLSAYLAEIVAAGGGSMNTSEATAEVLTSAIAVETSNALAVAENLPFSVAPQLLAAAVTTTVPEPGTSLLLTVAAVAIAVRRSPWRRNRRPKSRWSAAVCEARRNF